MPFCYSRTQGPYLEPQELSQKSTLGGSLRDLKLKILGKLTKCEDAVSMHRRIAPHGSGL